MSTADTHPVYASFFGFAGASLSMILACVGASFGMGISGSAIASVGVVNPKVVMLCLIPIIMASVLSIYGMVDTPYSLLSGSLHLASGLCCGLCSLASGYAIGIIGEAGVRGMIKQPKVLVGFVLLLIFAEVLGLYGLITGVIINLAATQQT